MSLDKDQLPSIVTLRGWNSNQLAAADSAASRLESELRASTITLERVRDAGKKVRFCVDFDVIRSASAVDPENEPLSFWSKLFLESGQSEFLLLPGTVVELLDYTRKLETKQNVRSHFADALLESFHKLKFDQVKLSSRYEEFIRQSVTSGDLIADERLANLVVDHLRPLSTSELCEIDGDVFYRSIVHLSHGARSGQFRNNRVDAYNLALVKALNDQNSDFLYVIVSNTSAMENLDKAVIQQSFYSGSSPFEELPDRSIVWKPARSFVFSVLDGVGNDASRISLGWRLVQNLSGFRSQLKAEKAARSSKRGRASDDEKVSKEENERVSFSPDEIMVRLLATVEALQADVSSVAGKAKSVFFSNVRKVAEIEDCFARLRGKLEAVLKEMPEVVSQVRPFPRRPVALKMGEIVDRGAGRRSAVILNASSSKEVAGCYNFNGDACIYFPSSANLEKALAVFNFVRQQVVVMVQTGQLDGEERSATGIMIGDRNRRETVDFKDVQLPLTEYGLREALSKRGGEPLSEVCFLRVNTHWFDVSFELAGKEAFVGIASHLAIGESVSSFVNELVGIADRSDGYAKIFGQIRSLVDPLSTHLEEYAV